MSTSEQSPANEGDDLTVMTGPTLEVATSLGKRSKKGDTPSQATSLAGPSRKSKRLERASSSPLEGPSRKYAALSSAESDLPMDAVKEAMLQAFADPSFRRLLFQGEATTPPFSAGSSVVSEASSLSADSVPSSAS